SPDLILSLGAGKRALAVLEKLVWGRAAWQATDGKSLEEEKAVYEEACLIGRRASYSGRISL
ncbi:MAG TPA: hypothetical protein VHD63_12890, partial [Ktedonobacteraceae bacterium]|nr:hypothetical protein [Ktedonobacteraceae bacterium]